jgi:hypothetical protein
MRVQRRSARGKVQRARRGERFIQREGLDKLYDFAELRDLRCDAFAKVGHPEGRQRTDG